jgi:hypothetical protein
MTLGFKSTRAGMCPVLECALAHLPCSCTSCVLVHPVSGIYRLIDGHPWAGGWCGRLVWAVGVGGWCGWVVWVVGVGGWCGWLVWVVGVGR